MSPGTTAARILAGPRSLHVICEMTRLACCEQCPAGPQQACVTRAGGAEGYHLVRFAAACMKGLLSAADVTAVLAVAGPAAAGSAVVYDDTFGGGS